MQKFVVDTNDVKKKNLHKLQNAYKRSAIIILMGQRFSNAGRNYVSLCHSMFYIFSRKYFLPQMNKKNLNERIKGGAYTVNKFHVELKVEL